MARFRRPRPAFLLLTVLVALLISGLLLAATARHSLLLATEAADRQRDLQLQWGASSCRRALLAAAREVFGDDLPAVSPGNGIDEPGPAAQGAISQHAVAQTIALGAAQFHVVLSDEDAKVNLNTLYHFDGRPSVERFVGEAWPGIPVRLRPQVPPRRLLQEELEDWDEDELPAAFRSWGQVADLNSSPARTNLPALAAGATCWGSGRLNLARASDQSIRRISGLVLSRGAVTRLIEDLRDYPRRPLERLLEQLGIDQKDQFLLQELLTKQSSSYGLWVAGGTGQRMMLQQWSVVERVEWLDDSGQPVSTFRRHTFSF